MIKPNIVLYCAQRMNSVSIEYCQTCFLLLKDQELADVGSRTVSGFFCMKAGVGTLRERLSSDKKIAVVNHSIYTVDVHCNYAPRAALIEHCRYNIELD